MQTWQIGCWITLTNICSEATLGASPQIGWISIDRCGCSGENWLKGCVSFERKCAVQEVSQPQRNSLRAGSKAIHLASLARSITGRDLSSTLNWKNGERR